MTDLVRAVKPRITWMRSSAVAVGRLFPAMPHHLRVTIGTPAEMRSFAEALAKLQNA